MASYVLAYGYMHAFTYIHTSTHYVCNIAMQLHSYIYIHMYVHSCDVVNSYNIGTNDHDLPDNVAMFKAKDIHFRHTTCSYVCYN